MKTRERENLGRVNPLLDQKRLELNGEKKRHEA
jgi:hypothetical protein